MADHEFTPGDTVRMKSGGAKMTYIGDSESTGLAICEWHTGKEKRTDTFHHVGLEQAKNDLGSIKLNRG
jgi:uncharacterized protein YodC (DUF2158 family)